MDTCKYKNTLSKVVFFRSGKVSRQYWVRIFHDTLTDKISYLWLNEGSESKIIVGKYKESDQRLKKGEQFPTVTLQTLNGDTISTQDLQGKIAVLNWWNTGCGPCVSEIPILNKLVDKYGETPNITFLAISINGKSSLERFISKKEFAFQQTMCDDETRKKIARGMPTSIVVAPNGNVQFYQVGASRDIYEKIDSEIEALLEGV